jgi:hypothetical protein
MSIEARSLGASTGKKSPAEAGEVLHEERCTVT